MVVVTIKGRLDTIEIKGHAMYDDFGKDIVCSGISSIVTTSVNAILTFNKNYIKYTIKDDLFTISVNEHNEIVDKVNPSIIMKAIKNDVQTKNNKDVHIGGKP